MKLIVAIIRPFKLDEVRKVVADLGVTGGTAPDQARQDQVSRRQVPAGIGQVGGVYVLDRPVHARDVGQQPEAETWHVEQVPYPHGITSQGEAFPRNLTAVV